MTNRLQSDASLVFLGRFLLASTALSLAWEPLSGYYLATLLPDTGGGPAVDYNIGSAIVAAAADRVVIQAAGGGGGGGSGSVTNFAAARADTSFLLLTFTEIPFGGEWLFALAGLAYGVYALYRRQ